MNFSSQPFLDKKSDERDNALLSIDLLPISKSLYDEVVAKIRSLQDQIHNTKMVGADGFVCLGWLGRYVPINGPR